MSQSKLCISTPWMTCKWTSSWSRPCNLDPRYPSTWASFPIPYMPILAKEHFQVHPHLKNQKPCNKFLAQAPSAMGCQCRQLLQPPCIFAQTWHCQGRSVHVILHSKARRNLQPQSSGPTTFTSWQRPEQRLRLSSLQQSLCRGSTSTLLPTTSTWSFVMISCIQPPFIIVIWCKTPRSWKWAWKLSQHQSSKSKL